MHSFSLKNWHACHKSSESAEIVKSHHIYVFSALKQCSAKKKNDVSSASGKQLTNNIHNLSHVNSQNY